MTGIAAAMASRRIAANAELISLHSCVGAPLKPSNQHIQIRNIASNHPFYLQESTMFKKMSAIEICHRMAAICQNSADVNLPGPERERFQCVSDKFRDEADTLALADLQHSPEWHIHCHGSKVADDRIRRRVRLIKTSDLKVVKDLLDESSLNWR